MSYSPCSNTYCGPHAYSEIEAGHVASYVQNSTVNWRVFYTMHSYSQLWMAPWGYTTDPPENYDELVWNTARALVLRDASIGYFAN